MTRLLDGGSHFRIRIILGTIPIWLLIFQICVPESSQNGSGVCPYRWLQEKFVCFSQSNQNAKLYPVELKEQFFNDSALNLFKSCVKISALPLGTDVFRDWPFSGRCTCVPLATAANFRLFLKVATFLKGNATQLWKMN